MSDTKTEQQEGILLKVGQRYILNFKDYLTLNKYLGTPDIIDNEDPYDSTLPQNFPLQICAYDFAGEIVNDGGDCLGQCSLGYALKLIEVTSEYCTCCCQRLSLISLF